MRGKYNGFEAAADATNQPNDNCFGNCDIFRNFVEPMHAIFSHRFKIGLLLLMLPFTLAAQRNVKDSLLFAPHISFTYAHQFPGGDMGMRFGPNSNIGGMFHVKTEKNFFYGIETTYLFSNNVTQPGLLSNLMTSNNEVIANDGDIAEVLVQQRGWLITANGGKLFPLRRSNPNSGILIKGGAGFMAHKIRLETQMHTVTQLEDEYLKGYDRLTTGLVLSQFVGYFHMSNNRFSNFFLGVETYQGFTRGRRPWNFDTQDRDDQLRFDLLAGVRVGWCIHIYKRTWRNFYY